jgi:hypothetical protein
MPLVAAPAPLFHPSWPEAARTLLRRAIDRHGGWALWSRLEAVSVGRLSLGGWLPRVKGYGRRFQLPAATVYPKRDRVEWDQTGLYHHGGVRLIHAGSGQALVDSHQHRRTFRGLRKLRGWSALDAFYFFGYALLSYLMVPFALPALPFLGTLGARWRGQPLTGVRVEFPPGADVHSRRQSYLFDASGLLRRNDYVADVVGLWARGAHFSEDYVTVDGLPIPSRRTVLPRLGPLVFPGPVVLSATLGDFAVRLDGG